MLALTVTPASADERTQVAALAAQVQAVTGEHVELAWVDQGDTGEAAEPLGRRASFAWAARFRRLARDDEQLPAVLAGLHFIAFACLLLHQVIPLIFSS